VAVRLIHLVETLELNCSRINNLYPDSFMIYQTVKDRDEELLHRAVLRTCDRTQNVCSKNEAHTRSIFVC
jgi:hypothetical protein